MKVKKVFLSTLLLSAITFTSCTEETNLVPTDETVAASALTTDEIAMALKTDLAIEDIAILANDQFEAKVGRYTSLPVLPALPPTTPYTSLLPANATSTTADAVSGPVTAPVATRTITITFGVTGNCVFRGHALKGQIILAHPYTTVATKTMTVTVNNFSVNGNIINGTATWSRALVGTAPNQRPKVTFTMTNFTYTTAAGVYARNGWITRDMTAGYSTNLDLTDDINTVDNAFVTVSPSNYSLSSCTISTLATPLVYKTSCSLGSTPVTFAGSGTQFFTKGSHSAVIKYGTGDCDNASKLAIDMNLASYFIVPIQFNSALYALVPNTTPPTTPPTYAEMAAKFDAKFDEMAVPFTLVDN